MNEPLSFVALRPLRPIANPFDAASLLRWAAWWLAEARYKRVRP